MPLEEFDFPFHRVETSNPDTGTRVQLGGSYVFTAAPNSPDQRTFKLFFPAMKFYTDNNGDLDSAIEPQKNMLALIEFYAEHKLHKSFLYDHPVHGEVTVKFRTPLTEPKGIPGGTGVTESFEVELMEIPL